MGAGLHCTRGAEVGKHGSTNTSFPVDATMAHLLNTSVAKQPGSKRGHAMSTGRQKNRAMGLTVLFLFVGCSFALAQLKETSKTQIVLLGTGTPAPDPERSGPSTAIVVNGTAYLISPVGRSVCCLNVPTRIISAKTRFWPASVLPTTRELFTTRYGVTEDLIPFVPSC